MNNTAKHTPGPWVYDAEEGTVYDVPSDGDAMMLMVSDAGNGNLIAAAPAMYEALKEWCDYYAAYNPVRDKRIEPFIKLTRQALAQAEGKSPAQRH